MADDGRYAPLLREPVPTAEQIAQRQIAKQKRDEEIKRRQRELELSSIRAALEAEDPNMDVVKVGDEWIPTPQAKADVPRQMDFEQRVLSSPLKERALARARTEELISDGLTPEEAAAQAKKEQQERKQSFELGRARAKSVGGDGASGFALKEAAALAQDAAYSAVGPIAHAAGYPQIGDRTEAFRSGMQAEMTDWRNEKSPYPELQGGVTGAASSALQMVPGIAVGAVAGPAVGMGYMAGQFGVQEYSNAAYEGKEAGLSGKELDRYATIQGGIEAAIMPAMSAIPGLGGIESQVLRRHIARGIASNPSVMKSLAGGAVAFTKESAAELAEELITEGLHGLAREKSLDEEVDYGQIIKDTTLNTMLMMGLMKGGQVAGNAVANRMQRNQQPPVVGPAPAVTPEPATEADSPVVEQAPEQQPIAPAIEAFLKEPGSAIKYERAVKAGLDPIEKPNRENRAKYAADKRKELSSVANPQPVVDPVVTNTEQPETVVPVETPSGAVPDGDLEMFRSLYEGNASGQESDVEGQLQGSQGNAEDGEKRTRQEGQVEGRQEGLLNQPEVVTPADSQQSPAAHTKETFTVEYNDLRSKLAELGQSPEAVPVRERLAEMFDAQTEWASELETTSPPVVGPGGTSPGQSLPPDAGQAPSIPAEAVEPQIAYPESAPVIEDWFGKDSARVIEWTKTDSPRTALKPKEYAAAYRSGVRVAAGPVSMVLKNAVDIVSNGKTERFFFGKGGIQLAVGIPKQREVAAIVSPEPVQAPVEQVPSPTPVPAFAALPQKSQDLFNKAFESKDVEQLKQMVDKSNVAWNKEFERRTGTKLPKTLKDRRQAVLDWAASQAAPVATEAPEPAKAETPNPTEESEKAVPWQRKAGEERADYNRKLKADGWAKADKVSIEATDSPGVVRQISLDQQKNAPYKNGDRVIVVTGYTNNDMKIGGYVIEDSLPESPTIKVRVDNGNVHYVSAYYTQKVEKTGESVAKEPATPKAETPPADSQPELSEVEQATLAGLMESLAPNQKPVKAEKKPRAPKAAAGSQPAAEKKPRSKVGQKTAKAREDAGKAVKDAFADFMKDMKDQKMIPVLIPGAPPLMNPKAVASAVKLTAALAKLGTVTFADFATLTVENIGAEVATKLAPYLETAWTMLKRVPGYEGVDEAGRISDFIGEPNGTGAADTEGRKEDSGTGEPDRRDGEDTNGPADAGVLEGEQAADDKAASKTRNPSSVRRGSRRKLRSGDGQTDSGTGNESERSGDDGGGTSPDEPGTGRDSAPQSTRPNYHLTNPAAIIGGGPKAKFERNRKAIEIVRNLEEANRAPTAEELDTLAGYMGWGAFGQELFKGSWTNPQPKEGWEEQDEWLRIYLGEAEWKSAQDSIVNAHFTDPQTVTAIWNMLRRFGFNGGRVLEPSIGVGNFFSLMPRDLMERSALTGIELDKITAKIAKLLHPNANIQQKGYQESQTPDNFYDVIVSNVPFGDYSIPDRRYKQDFSIHNYFFKKAFDQLKPGGVIAFLTSNMTMDGKVQAKLMRAQISNQGDLVTAIRLPSGAFQAYAGTKVVADLIVIRKRKAGEKPSGDKNWIQINEIATDDNKAHNIEVNEYWTNNPQNILGTMTWGHGTTTGRPGMIVNQPADLQASLDAAVAAATENIINTERGKSEGRERPNTTARRQNSILSENGDLWQVKGEHLVPLLDAVAWYRKGSKQATIDKNRKEIETLLGVREALRDVLDKQAASENADTARADLNKTYDAFVKEFGPVGKSAAGKHLRKAGDPMGHALLALESVSGLIVKKYTKRPIFTRATVRQKRNVENPTLNDAFALERNRSLDLDMDRIAAAAKMPVDVVVSKLVEEGRIYKTGNGTYDAADVFLSGNMARKLRQLEAAKAEGMDGLDRSIEAVSSRMPTPVPYSQIEAKLGATWITSEDYSNYVGAMLNEPGDRITVERRVQGWKVSIPTEINSKAEATTLYGHPGIEFNKLVAAAMNNATVRITMPDPDDRTKRITDPEGTEQANAKVSELRDNFSTWLWSDSERIARLSSVYNEEFNSTVTPEFDDVPLDFEGMAIERGDKPFNLRSHQASAVWRGIVSGKGIFAHEVGTGKTLTMAALAMENRRLGLASKPILLAHNANSLAVRNEIQEAYPGANILYVDNMDSANKDTMLQSIATEDWDLIVVPHSMAERFMLRPETVEALLKPEMDALEAAALEAFAESEASDYAKGEMPADLNEISDEELQALREPTAKELVKERMKLRAQIVKAQQAMGAGNGIFFEDMGIDMVMVDEAHLFKKLPITSKQRIKGLNKSASQMGNMMMMMTDYIRMNNKGRGVYLFTGTPITNTVNEVFNMMRFVMAEEMEQSGVRSWDGWFNNFATQDTMTELSSGGTWENFDRIASFVNLPELRQMVGQYMDIVFADDMPEFKPRESREGRTEDPIGRPFKQVHNVIIDMLDAQRELSKRLADRYITFRDAEGKDKIKMMREPGGQFNPLVIEGEGVKLAMDPRLTGYGTTIVDDKAVTDESVLNPRDPNLKINKMVRNAMSHYNESPTSTQMIFMQVGYTDSVERTVGRNDDGKPIKERFRVFNLAKEIKRRLIEEGVAENEIAIFSGLSKEKRAEAALLMQEGKIRFAIGSTETMGTGVNAQNELVAMHHLDAPWMPGDLEQRNGRGHRQGNRWNTVNEYRYLTEGPQDGRRWQVLLTKDKFIKDFMRGDAKARTIEMDDVDLSEDGEGTDMEQTFSAAAGDPRIMQRIRLEGQVEKLVRQRDNYAQMITDTARKASTTKRGIADKKASIDKLTSLYETWKSNRTEEPEVTINGKTYVGAKDITFELQNIAERYQNKMHDAVEIGSYRGIPLYAINEELHIGKPSTLDSLELFRMGTKNPNIVTARWNYQSLQGILSNLPDRISKQKAAIDKDQQFIDMAQKSASEPFPKMKQLDGKQKKLEAIKAEMAANPDVSPPWLRSGAPIGTSVYWKGEKYDVAGHRGDDKVLYADGDDFKTLPAAELTDDQGTRLFPQLEIKAPAGTPDAATPAAGPSELRQSANEAQAAVDAQKAENAKLTSQILNITRNSALGGGIPNISKELADLLARRTLGAIRLGIKQFDAFIKTLRADMSESELLPLKPTFIRAWNAGRDKFGLDEATELGFDAAMSDTVDADVEQLSGAIVDEPSEPSTPTADPATQPAATQDPATLEPERTYSAKNAFTDSERARLGLPERQPKTPRPNEPLVELAAAMAKTEQGRIKTDELIAELTVRPRATTPLENHQLTVRYAQLDQKYEAALEERNAARRIGDDATEAIAEHESGLFLKEQTELLELLSGDVSYFLGAGLQARKTLINRDFSMARSVLEFEAAYGREPNDDEKAAMEKQIADLAAANAELQRLLDERDSSIDDLNAKLKEAHYAAVNGRPEKKPSVLERIAQSGKEKVDRGFEKLNAMRGKLFSVETATSELISALADIATGYSMQGVTKLADFLSRVEKRFGPDAKKITAQLTTAWNNVVASSSKDELEQITDKIDPMDDDTIGRAARDLHRFVIQRDGLDASAEGRNAAVVAVYEIMRDKVEGITEDQVARAMSGIGVYSELNKDAIEVIRRDQKAQLMLLEQIRDANRGELSPRTGQERELRSDEQRALLKVKNEAIKAAGIITGGPGQLRSALDAAKRMTRNRISDLTKAIESGQRIAVSRKLLTPDAELTALQAERDALQKLYDLAFGKGQLSDEQRANAAEKALDRAISKMEADLASGKLYSDPAKAPVSSPAIEAKRAALDALKASREELRLSSGEAQARSDAAYERHLLEKDAELARRLAENDFMPAGKKPARELTPEMKRKMLEIQKKQEALLKRKKEWEFENRHPIYKLWKTYPVQGMSMVRKGLTTIDQSLIGRQGWLLGLAHPILYGKSIKKAFGSNWLSGKSIFPTEQDLFNAEQELDADADWVRLEKIAKLAVTGVHGGMKKAEENNSDVPEWFDKIPGIGGSERAGSAFINTQRRLVFRQLVSQLATRQEANGPSSVSTADLRVIANLINVSSGRATLGEHENAIKMLTAVFFSPRWWASRLMWLSGQPMWSNAKWAKGEGVSKEARQLVMKEWATQAATQAAVMTIAVAGLIAAFGEPGDDEEWDWYMNWSNPNFGRIRIGSTYIDMTAGLGQHIALFGQMYTGKRIDRWETKDVDKFRMVSNQIRGKLAPMPGIFADWLDGQSISQEPFGSTEWYASKAIPLSIQDVAETFKQEGVELGSIVSMLMFFGMGAQTREAKVKSRTEAVNEIRAMRKQGQSPETIQAALNKHLKYTAALEAKEKLRTASPDEKPALESVVAGDSASALESAIEKERQDITLRAIERLSTEDKTGKKAPKEDASITTARALLKEIAPTFEQAEAVFKAAYKARHGMLVEQRVGPSGYKRWVEKESVTKAKRRLRAMYQKN